MNITKTARALKALSIGALVVAVTSGCSWRSEGAQSLAFDAFATEKANADASGEASSVAVTWYQLIDKQAFLSAEYEAFKDTENDFLSDVTVKKSKLYLSPGRYKYGVIDYAKEAKYLGVVAGLRNPEGAAWRQIIELPEEGKHKVYVLVEEHSVEVFLAEKKGKLF